MVELSDKLTWDGYSGTARGDGGMKGLRLCTAKGLAARHIKEHLTGAFKSMSGENIKENLHLMVLEI
ncbi:MAG: hypothetical protein HRU03_05785 [Nanoarchaeales archaeon]|nr:hypothetical protein [Nanoarchaeales archaeon]